MNSGRPLLAATLGRNLAIYGTVREFLCALNRLANFPRGILTQAAGTHKK
jgi:hypothetical protein